MRYLVAAGVPVPSTAVINFPKLALSVGAKEAARRVYPRSISSPALSEVRAMKVKWGKLGKRGLWQCTDGTMDKTDKKSPQARKKTISRSRIWQAYASPTNHNYTQIQSCDSDSPRHTTRTKSCRTTPLKNASRRRCWLGSTGRPPGRDAPLG
jgi:hypothetical protein